MRKHLALIAAASLAVGGFYFVGCDRGNSGGTGTGTNRTGTNSPGGTGTGTTGTTNTGTSGPRAAPAPLEPGPEPPGEPVPAARAGADKTHDAFKLLILRNSSAATLLIWRY